MTDTNIGGCAGAAALSGGVAAPDSERSAAVSSLPVCRARNGGRNREAFEGLTATERRIGRRPIQAWSWSHTQTSDLWDAPRLRSQPPWHRLVALLLALAVAALLAQVGL